MKENGIRILRDAKGQKQNKCTVLNLKFKFKL